MKESIDPLENSRQKLRDHYEVVFDVELAEYARQKYTEAQKELGRKGRLYSMAELPSGVWSIPICLFCNSDKISMGYIGVSYDRYEADYACGGDMLVEPQHGLDYYQCRDCRRVLYCEDV